MIADIPVPTIEVTRNVVLPRARTTSPVTMVGLRWWWGETEFECATYTPEIGPAGGKNNDHYEVMAMQHVLTEFVKWCNGRGGKE